MRLEETTVLVVDDEPMLLKIFSAWLERSGCQVLTAVNGAEGLQALKSLQPGRVDVMVSDVRMPVMDGITLVRRIHAEGLAIPSIVFVSGFSDVAAREAHDLGVERMLEKPLRRADLLEAVERSVMDREYLWLTPREEPMEQRVSLLMHDAYDGGVTGSGFRLGRGGCCFPSERSLAVGDGVDLCLRFPDGQAALRAQGDVRWYDTEKRQAGMAFSYLDPGCRGWVIRQMKDPGLRSFIPGG